MGLLLILCEAEYALNIYMSERVSPRFLLDLLQGVKFVRKVVHY